MSNSYSLEIISKDHNSNGQSLRKHNLKDTDYVGVHKNEPFEIIFKNNTWKKIQVRLSLDGMDLLTGELANTDPVGKMFVVNGYDTLILKAWPETNQNGAQFIFTDTKESVVAHIHDNLSSKGIIAAAVYIEGHGWWESHNVTWLIGGAQINRPYYDYYCPKTYEPYRYDPYWITCSTNNDSVKLSETYYSVWQNNCSVSGTTNVSGSVETNTFYSSAAIGAGQTIEQHIVDSAGLIKPTFAEIIKLKYMWHDELVQMFKKHHIESCESGFPGNQKRLMNIGNTPRQNPCQVACPCPRF